MRTEQSHSEGDGEPQEQSSSLDDETRKIIQQLTKDYLLRLSEHTTSVLVLISYESPDGTLMYTDRGGNYYAQIGTLKEYNDREEERSRIAVRD